MGRGAGGTYAGTGGTYAETIKKPKTDAEKVKARSVSSLHTAGARWD